LKTKLLFFAVMGISLIMIFLYNFYTPLFSDDLHYIWQVRDNNSFLDLIKMTFNAYVEYNPRLIGHFYTFYAASISKFLFNIINSGHFVMLIFLIYLNTKTVQKTKYDIFLFLLTLFFYWRYAVEFGDTILWLSGAASYLWPMTIMLGFISLYRYLLVTSKKNQNLFIYTFLFIIAVLSGWCNENTSGGVIIIILFFTINKMKELKKDNQNVIRKEMIIAITGVVIGFIGLLSSPGAYNRIGTFEENYSGLIGLASRLYYILLTIHGLFFELLVITVILVIFVIVIKRKWDQVLAQVVPFFFAGIATCFALVLIPVPSARAYFGAGVFLVIACLKCFVLFIDSEEKEATAIKYITFSLLLMWFIFDYQANLVNVARVYREENERLTIMEQAKMNGLNEVVVPQLSGDFKSRYSSIHNHDMTEDYGFWINTYYRNYFGIYKITAIPRSVWDEYYGDK